MGLHTTNWTFARMLLQFNVIFATGLPLQRKRNDNWHQLRDGRANQIIGFSFSIMLFGLLVGDENPLARLFGQFEQDEQFCSIFLWLAHPKRSKVLSSIRSMRLIWQILPQWHQNGRKNNNNNNSDIGDDIDNDHIV